jgi:hypothetical protein
MLQAGRTARATALTGLTNLGGTWGAQTETKRDHLWLNLTASIGSRSG